MFISFFHQCVAVGLLAARKSRDIGEFRHDHALLTSQRNN